MKKSMLFTSFAMLAIFPAYLTAQEIQLPTIEVTVTQDKVPAVVKQAVLKDFGEDHKPFAWVTTQSRFDTYAWELSTNIDNLEIYNYSLRTITNTGSSLDVVYTADGKLITSREYLKNFRPADHILMALQNSEFNGWAIHSDFHVIKTNDKGVVKERYALNLRKGNDKKTVYFDPSGKLIADVKGELADANW